MKGDRKMDFQYYTQFATENPVCYLATVEGDQPRVRTFLLWYADESGFYFVLMSPKEVTKQLQQNPKAEVCFYNNAADPADWKQMRVTGEVEFLEDEENLEKAYQNRSFLDDIVGFSVRPLVRPIRISTGEVHFWTLADNLKEPEIERTKF
jgi:pyridoxamine 5'-phosphate oxidase